jgi:hypothetical protein
MSEIVLELVVGLLEIVFCDVILFIVKAFFGGIRILVCLAIDAFADWQNARRRQRDKFKQETMGKAGHVLGIPHPDKDRARQ